MGVYISKQFSTPDEFEAWVKAQEHGNKDFLDKLCEQDKEKWDNKACKMTVKDGKLQLLCEKGNVLAEADYYQPDGDTVCCDGKDGKLSIKGIQNANDPNGKKYRVWIGTQAEYNAIRVKDPKTMYYITDETLLDDILSGLIKVGYAAEADQATEANHTKVWVLSSLGGLVQMIQSNPACSIGISIRTEQSGIEIPTTTGNVLIPNWAYGTLTIDEIGDASIHLTAYTGEVFHLFYNGNGGAWVKGSIKADSATYDSDGNKITETYVKRRLFWSGSKTISSRSYADIWCDENANNKYLVIQTDGYRLPPMRFDVGDTAVSIERSFDDKFRVYMDNTALKRVRIYNDLGSSITVLKIFEEI